MAAPTPTPLPPQRVAPAPPNAQVAELIADIRDTYGRWSTPVVSHVPTPTYVDPCGVCTQANSEYAETWDVLDSVAAICHRNVDGALAYRTPVCADHGTSEYGYQCSASVAVWVEVWA